ncbi:putative mannose-sensitive agglutinin (MSHA) biogenesis protein MshJ [Sulfuricella denitrificans skB26]|uniref:Putative mannose-sensitive agglutinin (MSHA) biogenesis protein MshJ n=1 Tax=Sulfuricella denitrificans (strain DSM 22764 / NBRC 105220 / skB26) TaxID=1163617 RepID=S6ADH5_SULDS|nr:type II secretion system protein M [Sulfuricella denitrificans]BAN36473.1 putative mannose-sensitive agglutinin (MSHA) biogenesis protein MshJ [Sulfuricella denitrificans skB26]
MKQYWERYAALLNARNSRERALIFVMVMVVVWALLSALFLDPLLAKKKRLTLEATQQQTEIQQLRAQIENMLSGGRVDPDAATRAMLAELNQKLEQSRAALQSVQQSLVPPEKMARLLEDVLTQNRNLKLVSLKTLPVSGVLETPADAAALKNEEKTPASPAIYKHGVEITVSGSYAELTQYLDTMEKLPWRMIWGKAEMRVEEYPLVVLTITLYTLSMDKTWLSV